MNEIRTTPPRLDTAPPAVQQVTSVDAAILTPQAGVSGHIVGRRDASARSILERQPGVSAASFNALVPLLEPKTPEMKSLDNIDRPNSNVRKDTAGLLDTVFQEEMQALGLSFKDGRMHPLLHYKCEEIEAQLGSEMRHPKLKNEFGIVLIYKLIQTLKNLPRLRRVTDQSGYPKRGLYLLLHARAKTYVAARLGLCDDDKESPDKTEYKKFRAKLDSGNLAKSLSNSFDCFGAAGLLVLENLAERLRTTTQEGSKRVPSKPATVKQKLNCASRLMAQAQRLFPPEPGRLAVWLGDPAREEAVVVAAAAAVNPRKKDDHNDALQSQKYSFRQNFDACLPHLRASVQADQADAMALNCMPTMSGAEPNSEPIVTQDPHAIQGLSPQIFPETLAVSLESDTAFPSEQTQPMKFLDFDLSYFDGPVAGKKRKAEEAFLGKNSEKSGPDSP
jgi:hypothetical protein